MVNQPTEKATHRDLLEMLRQKTIDNKRPDAHLLEHYDCEGIDDFLSSDSPLPSLPYHHRIGQLDLHRYNGKVRLRWERARFKFVLVDEVEYPII